MANKHDNNREKNLYYLNELSDYKVASDDPDVRGWQVKDADNRVIGKVDNLLVNKGTERVVYLDVEVDKTIIEANHDPYGQPANGDVHEFINKDGENHIIVPIGLVNINYDPDYVYTDRINHQTFAETKRYSKGSGNINRDYEVVVLESYSRNRRDDDRDSNYAGRRDSDRRDDDFDRDRDRRASDSNVGRDRGRIPDDDSFYKRREFDDSNYRRRR